MPSTVLHKANTRGLSEAGWLHSRHTFSFGGYHNPERMRFGVLRVLNDDIVAPGMGFGRHPHDNMEIVSIPLEGELEHRDSMSNVAVIRAGDVQVMSAGTGIEHSEYNKNDNLEVKFLQIWLFPKQRNVSPRYDQISLPADACHNTMTQILSPDPNDAGVWVHQDAWFHLGRLDKGVQLHHTLKREGNGLYAFVIGGEVRVGDQPLGPRDGYGLTEIREIEIESLSDGAELLLMEIPMSL